MAEHPRPARALGRHFLVPRVAADLVRNAGVTRGDLVVEIGAGAGALTHELAARAGRVVAIELDPRLVSVLRRRHRSDRRVQIVEGDAFEVPLPRRPFRVVANIPFAHTSAILRGLFDDPGSPLLRADFVVQWGVAVKRCSQRPSTLGTLTWAPWFEFTITRRLPRSSFRPPPQADAAVMTVTRRPDPLLDVEDRDAFVAFLRRRFARRRGAVDLDVWEWTRLFRR